LHGRASPAPISTSRLLTGTASAADNRRILDALDRAIRLDPKLALAYFTRAGFELTVSWDWKAAAASVERVREIEPGSDLLPRALGGLALTFGQVDRAVELYEKALERDPLERALSGLSRRCLVRRQPQPVSVCKPLEAAAAAPGVWRGL